jgi:large subunit ribosomal protein L18
MSKKKRKIIGTKERPRLSVFRSINNIHVQIIDDFESKTLLSESSLTFDKGGNVAAAKEVGRLLAQKALEKGIKSVVFDRGRVRYHGRVKALAEAAREGGLIF